MKIRKALVTRSILMTLTKNWVRKQSALAVMKYVAHNWWKSYLYPCILSKKVARFFVLAYVFQMQIFGKLLVTKSHHVEFYDTVNPSCWSFCQIYLYYQNLRGGCHCLTGDSEKCFLGWFEHLNACELVLVLSEEDKVLLLW